VVSCGFYLLLIAIVYDCFYLVYFGFVKMYLSLSVLFLPVPGNEWTEITTAVLFIQTVNYKV
jgi:hypothetical protein